MPSIKSATSALRPRFLVCVLALAGIASLGGYAGSAEALPIHAFGSSFAKEGSGAGELLEPTGVAVEEVALAQAGDVYVVDTGGNRVQWFSSEGKELKGEFDGSLTPAASFSSPTSIAIDNSSSPFDPSAGDIYVADFGHSVVDKFDAEGKYLGQIATGLGGAALGEIYGVAVDGDGDVWVDQASKEIDRYDNALANALVSSTSSPFEETSPGFAVDPEDHLYVNKGTLRFAKLNSLGEILIRSINPEEDATAAAVNLANGNVYIDEGSTIAGFDPTARPLERFGAGHLASSRAVAIDSGSGDAYASNHENGTVAVFPIVHTPTALTGEATNLAAEGAATLNGTIDPEGVEVSSCKFEYGLTTAYGSTAECASLPGSGIGPVPVSADVSGLEIARYHFRLLATNENGEAVGLDHSLIASSHPSIRGEALASVNGTTATIGAQVNPNGLPTTYRLEYGTSAAYGSITPPISMGAGFAQSGVQVTLSGLAPATVYHARVVASNERATVRGAKDILFTTTAPGGETSASTCPNRALTGFSPLLPDCRAYELVSGEGGPGEVYTPPAPNVVPFRNEDISTELAAMRAAATGSRVLYAAEAPEVGGSGATGRGLGNQFLASRDSAGQWSAQPITQQVPESEVIPQSPVFEAYSPDLSTGLFTSNSSALARSATPEGPQGCQGLYSRSEDGAIHALFGSTRTPGHCGTSPSAFGFSAQNLLFSGANEGSASVPANSHLIFQSPAPLTDDALASVEGGEGNSLYESAGGVTRLVSVLPGGEADANAVFGGPPARPSINRPNFGNAISADGSRIFWTDLTSGRLYMRVSATATVAVSEGAAAFMGASSDGRYALYTEGEGLWRFDTQSGAGGSREELVSAGAKAQGLAGLSEDGAYVYFVAGGALAPGAESRNCSGAQREEEEIREERELTLEEAIELAGEASEELRGQLPAGRGCNLYAWHAGSTHLIAALSALDDQFTRESGNGIVELGAWQPELGSRLAAVADGGQELVFQSALQLTGFDNTNLDEELGREHGAEVFVYDASDQRLTCASCNPNGERPSEVRGLGGGTYLPSSASPTFVRRWVSGDGSRVFFDSSQPLVASDANGVQDVYEWERAGSGTCPSDKANGCISLISGGDSNDLSFFVDASANGSDVFFTHRGQLGGVGDENGRTGLFDARIEGGREEPAAGCIATACQSALASGSSVPSPGSVSARGGENASTALAPQIAKRKLSRAKLLAKALHACRAKKRGHGRVACERRARARYGATHARHKKPASKKHSGASSGKRP